MHVYIYTYVVPCAFLEWTGAILFSWFHYYIGENLIYKKIKQWKCKSWGFFNITNAFDAIFKAECTGYSKKLESIIFNEACEFISFL